MQKDTTEATTSSTERCRFAATTIGGIAATATATLMTSSALAQDSTATFPHILVGRRVFTTPLFTAGMAISAFERALNGGEITRTQIVQACNQVLQMFASFSHTTAVVIGQTVVGINKAIAGANLSPFVSALIAGTARAIGRKPGLGSATRARLTSSRA